MGCHICFGRPITDEELALMRNYAVKDAEECLMDGLFVNAIKLSVETGEPQPELYGCTWWQLGYGARNPALGENFTVFERNGTLYVDCNDFLNTANKSIGIYTYPHKIIHNKRELRRYIGKRYFNITSLEHLKLSEFWDKHPKGIMCWR